MKPLPIFVMLLAAGPAIAFAAALAAALPCAAQQQDAPPRSHRRHVDAAAVRPAAAANLNVPATDFSQLKPVLPAAASQGRGGKRRGGGMRPSMTTGF